MIFVVMFFTKDITFDYNNIKDIDYLLKDIKINNKIFDTL